MGRVKQQDNERIDATLFAGGNLRLTITASDDALRRPGVKIKIDSTGGVKFVEISESGELRLR